MKKYTIEEMQKMDNPPYIKCITVEMGRKLGKYYKRDSPSCNVWEYFNFKGKIPFFVYVGNEKHTGGWDQNIGYIQEQKREIIDFSQVIFPEDQQNSNNMKEEYKVDKDFILQAHKAACSEWKGKLEDKFPDVFIDQPVQFLHKELLVTSHTRGGVLYIGNISAEKSLENKCLIVGDGYRVEVKIHPTSGRQQLVFYKKKD